MEAQARGTKKDEGILTPTLGRVSFGFESKRGGEGGGGGQGDSDPDADAGSAEAKIEFPAGVTAGEQLRFGSAVAKPEKGWGRDNCQRGEARLRAAFARDENR
jgi:hypothetical protein